MRIKIIRHSKKTRAGWHYIVKGITNRILYTTLTKVAEIPPRMLFSLKIFKDYTISCLKEIANFPNDLINSFTHKIEKFSQIELILERLNEDKHGTYIKSNVLKQHLI